MVIGQALVQIRNAETLVQTENAEEKLNNISYEKSSPPNLTQY